MEIARIAVDQVEAAIYNPREDLKPDDPAYVAIKRSLDTWGLVEPLVWNSRSGNLVSGHQRFKILVAQGISHVEVSVVDLDQPSEMALNVALNRVVGRWDDVKLSDLLSGLAESAVDLSVTGFDVEELADLTASLDPKLFTPAVGNVLVERQVTQADMATAAMREKKKMKGEKKAQDVLCPHCGGSFGVAL